jgi:hypothetical protein
MKKPRKGISKRTRFEVFKRDSFTCQYCNRKPPDVMLEIDHVIPVAGGGSDRIDNLITACFDCNAGKSDVPLEDKMPEAFTENELIRCQELLERRAAMKRIDAIHRTIQKDVDKDINACIAAWDQWHHIEDKTPIALPDDHRRSLGIFLEKLPLSEILDSIEIAMHKKIGGDYKVWKYFCGVVWHKAKGLGPDGAEKHL